MKQAVLLAMVAVLVSGCVAAHPDSIKPMSISTMGYAQSDCAALAVEDKRVADRLFRLTVLQGRQRTTDIVAGIAVGVTATSLGSPEYAAEISRLKGERETIASVKASKSCSEPAAAADEARIRQEIAAEDAASQQSMAAARANNR